MKEKYSIAIDLGGTKTSSAIINTKGEIIDYKIQSSLFEKGLKALTEMLNKIIEDRITNSKLKINAVGIAASGRIDVKLGKIIAGVPLCEGYIGWAIRDDLTKKIKIPMIIENDANAAAYAEYKVGAGSLAKRLVCITIGTGIGGGIVINGELLSGNGNAGEIGHIIIKKNGKQCGCGNRGCLEKYVSRKIMENEVRKAIKTKKLNLKVPLEKITTDTIISLIKEKNSAMVKIFKSQISYLSIAISNLVNIIDPDLILISGQISQLGDILIDEIKSQIKNKTEIKLAGLGDKAGLIGAGLLALQNF